MINKDKSILEVFQLIENTFGNDIFILRDYWGDDYSIGMEKDKKLMYIAVKEPECRLFFYECENLLENHNVPYASYAKEDNVAKERLLEVIQTFFQLDR